MSATYIFEEFIRNEENNIQFGINIRIIRMININTAQNILAK
jgi:hypothetical protein